MLPVSWNWFRHNDTVAAPIPRRSLISATVLPASVKAMIAACSWPFKCFLPPSSQSMSKTYSFVDWAFFKSLKHSLSPILPPHTLYRSLTSTLSKKEKVLVIWWALDQNVWVTNAIKCNTKNIFLNKQFAREVGRI
jgi:hypothetical protein